ncbi:uncharacterized protein LOC18440343 isoform X2 [Amborella trichopoda]|uniref:uncharacterized protein LOC18440343 isoform X2 n=1 Tax=Amborella trichopoda TaxID=13333 RepID=UPI0009C19C97|nr:uncharacterized protein LOC18440343 isoform X2 [Amborella trichopoda]|eukprot:XP_020526678.1 uncharacterized protein LOC18440343 isoform X2 [Amborella trichopoda]
MVHQEVTNLRRRILLWQLHNLENPKKSRWQAVEKRDNGSSVVVPIAKSTEVLSHSSALLNSSGAELVMNHSSQGEGVKEKDDKESKQEIHFHVKNGTLEKESSEMAYGHTSHVKNEKLDKTNVPNEESNPENMTVEGSKGNPQKEGNEKENLSEKPKVQKGVPSSSKPARKDKYGAEECDASNQCMDEKKKLVACLRVPGNESPELSLLIQNIGNETLTINIMAPNFVRLEQNIVQLKKQDDREVKVSIGISNNDNSAIVLTTGKGRCILDLRGVVLPESSKPTLFQRLTYRTIGTRTTVIYLSVLSSMLLFIGGTWFCCNKLRPGGVKYQEVETDLPISGPGKPDLEVGWDEGWGDGWEDEEAPRTPSRPLQSLSASGLITRRAGKDERPDFRVGRGPKF